MPLKLKSLVFLLILLPSLQGCEELTQSITDEIFECLIKVSPKLPDKGFPDAELGVRYEKSIKATLRNSIDNAAVRYTFSIEGDLPPTLSYVSDGRKLIIRGLPTEKGRFNFTVFAYIDPWDDEDSLQRDCFKSDFTEKEYSIEVK